MEIKFTHAVSKIQSIIDGINTGIMQDELKEGDNLPSINELSTRCQVSRDTVFKAYQKLKTQGIIDSTPTKGYFVKGQVNRTLLLLDTYTSFKLNLYHRLIENLPENNKVELIFHQYNDDLFRTIINESIGKYNTYLVMNPSNNQLSDALHSIPENKLLLLDFGGFEKGNLSYICQNFNESLYDCLLSELNVIQDYKNFTLVFPENSCHPQIIKNAFNKFLQQTKMTGNIINGFSGIDSIQKGTLYLCVSSEIMVEILKSAQRSGLKCGNEFGLIAYNDEPVLEVIQNGISAVSIDFGMMGEMAAKFVLTKTPVREFLPTKFFKRKSC